MTSIPIARFGPSISIGRLLPPLALLLFIVRLGLPQDPDPLSSFQLHPDFQLELVAVEPLVMDPVDLAFDEHGDAYVLEMGGYPTASSDPERYPGNLIRLARLTNNTEYLDRAGRLLESFAPQLEEAPSAFPNMAVALSRWLETR